ncbi:hypothetical protein BDY21DRAFT_354343 [Lineolata rhizophorae]|uniref:EthD domain-containing protein n=1 Tax=Lineolata rhizophorae TaxID=578093 RepID=A0A6A6NR12_9PEZI|nr:hypothetical protein BDY21DRAFT_354343 [Lineolata rhizophorae]
MAPKKETVLKLTSMRYRAPGVTEEEFHDFASRKHAPLAAVIQARHGALKAAQYHTPSSARQLMKDKFPFVVRPGFTIDDHDIQISFWVRSTDTMLAILTDPDFQALVTGEDELKLADQDRGTLVTGWEEVYVEDGKVVNVEDGECMYGTYAERSACLRAGGAQGPNELPF